MSNKPYNTPLIRNIAIIAHVDHGKTTCVDAFLKRCQGDEKITERAMDSNQIEKERGITILAKITSIEYKGHKINIMDTPGHSDFGGEVQRGLQAVDGVLLIVDAVEGIMAQTQYVARKALALGLKVIVFINKVDRRDAERDVVEMTQLMVEDFLLNIDPKTKDTPFFYGSGRLGTAAESLDDALTRGNIDVLLDAVIKHVPAPTIPDEKNRFFTSILEYDKHFGIMLIGKNYSGTLQTGEQVISLDQQGKEVERFRLNKIFGFSGMKRVIIDQVGPGDMACLVGATSSTVNDTIVKTADTSVISAPNIDPPVFSVIISASPRSMREGTLVTTNQIKARLEKEARTNVGIFLQHQGDSVEISGRGELQISILIEQMRREGFELSISSPKVIIKTENGVKTEPFEDITITANSNYYGSIVDELVNKRGATLESVSYSENKQAEKDDKGGETMIIKCRIASRLFLGYNSEFISLTNGSGIIERQFVGYGPYLTSKTNKRSNGSLISVDEGRATAYAMDKLQDRGIFFIAAETQVFKGMIIGENNKENNLGVNVTKTKQLTNIRAAGKDDAIRLTPPRTMTIEQAIVYLQDQERLIITPKTIALEYTGKL